MDIETRPIGWRKGQTIFNFLEWVHSEGFDTDSSSPQGRLADPFYMEDDEFDALYIKFLGSLK